MPQSILQHLTVPVTLLTLLVGCGTTHVPQAQRASIQGRTLDGRTYTFYGLDALLQAIMVNDVKTAKEVMDEGIDISKPLGKGINTFTFLHLAVQKDNVAIAEMLIRRGAKINASNGLDGQGKTPLDNALYHKYEEMALMLRKHGARQADAL